MKDSRKKPQQTAENTIEKNSEQATTQFLKDIYKLLDERLPKPLKASDMM